MSINRIDLERLRTDALQVGHLVEQYAIGRIGLQNVHPSDTVRVALVAMAMRLCRSQQAVCVLVSQRLNDAAAAVLRGMVEQALLMDAVATDPKNLELAREEAESERRKALEGLFKLGPDERPAEVTEQAIADQLSQFDAKRKFQVYEWARVTENLGVYHTLWRSLSTYAHGSLLAIDRYVEVSKDGKKMSIISEVEPVASVDYVITTCSMVLNALKAIEQMDASELELAQWSTLQASVQSLQERFLGLPDVYMQVTG